ncbi:MAG: hypothetical protein IKB86_01985 [Clostridia bacterium]|nr:hypothetical protein [Clostridia bacterium]
MTVRQLTEIQGFSPVVLADPEREIKNVYIGDLLSWVMGKAQQDDAWITIMSNVNVLAVATLADTACVILAEGVLLDADVKLTAEQKGVNVISTDKSAYEIAKILAKANE